MAQKTVVTFLDDLDGESEAESTVPFALDGVEHEIDLTKENPEDLRDIFAPYIAVGQRTDCPPAPSMPRAAARRKHADGGIRSTGSGPALPAAGLRPHPGRGIWLVGSSSTSISERGGRPR
jgi:hypothetical protein